MLGILGGMGPLATADFLTKVVRNTDASSDQDHIPIIVRCVPQVPDRTLALAGQGPSPLPALTLGLQALVSAGASVIAIPCNTAHAWYDELQERASIPIVHIAEATAEALAFRVARGARIGILATRGTLATGIYSSRLGAAGYEPLVPSDADQDSLVTPAIALVKSGNIVDARRLLRRAIWRLRERGTEGVVLACTEIPVALTGSHLTLDPDLLDATEALARACVDRFSPPSRRARSRG